MNLLHTYPKSTKSFSREMFLFWTKFTQKTRYLDVFLECDFFPLNNSFLRN